MWYYPQGGKWKPQQERTHYTPRPFFFYLFYGAKAFISGGAGNEHNHPEDTGENSLQLGRGKNSQREGGRGRSLLLFSGKEISVSPEKSLGEKQKN